MVLEKKVLKVTELLKKKETAFKVHATLTEFATAVFL